MTSHNGRILWSFDTMVENISSFTRLTLTILSSWQEDKKVAEAILEVPNDHLNGYTRLSKCMQVEYV